MDANHAARCEGHRKLHKRRREDGIKAALTEIISNKTKSVSHSSFDESVDKSNSW